MPRKKKEEPDTITIESNDLRFGNKSVTMTTEQFDRATQQLIAGGITMTRDELQGAIQQVLGETPRDADDSDTADRIVNLADLYAGLAPGTVSIRGQIATYQVQQDEPAKEITLKVLLHNNNQNRMLLARLESSFVNIIGSELPDPDEGASDENPAQMKLEV